MSDEKAPYRSDEWWHNLVDTLAPYFADKSCPDCDGSGKTPRDKMCICVKRRTDAILAGEIKPPG